MNPNPTAGSERRLSITNGAAALAVSVWGESGSPLVALHPGVADRRCWRWCAPRWVAAGLRVVAYDRRGFGETDYEPEPHDDVDDLRAVTTAADARPAIVLGNSRGGAIAVDHALDHPDEVTALVLVAPSPSGYDDDRWPTMAAEAALDRQIAAAEERDDLELVNRLEVRYWLDGVGQPEGRVAGDARQLMSDMNGRALRAAPIGERAARPPAWGRLSALTMPVLVVCGQHDLDGCRQLCDELAAAVPGARRVDIADSAHCPQLDQPEALAAVVLDFVSSLSSSS